MALRDEISALNAEMLGQMPDEVKDVIMATTGNLVKTGISKQSLKEGDTIPGFKLPNAKGEDVDASDLTSDGPTVISFYRGGWCPYCNLELKALQNSLPEIKNLGAKLIAITPETPDNSMTTIEKNNLEFEVLSDKGNEIARAFGLVFNLAEELRPIYDGFGIDIKGHNGDDSFTLPMPATYVVDKNGKIVKSFVSEDHTQRMEPSEVISALKGLQ